MNPFTISKNKFLKQEIQAYYHQDYLGFGKEGNPDFINHLKNTFRDTNDLILKESAIELEKILKADLPIIQGKHQDVNFTVCVVPRAKMEECYDRRQKGFKIIVSKVVDELEGLLNGTIYISRIKNTITTHMHKSGHGGDGELPYPGITRDTCTISDEVKGKDILLIDDIYTHSINIDEDAIQALIDKGANSVVFYAIGKTLSKYEIFIPRTTGIPRASKLMRTPSKH